MSGVNTYMSKLGKRIVVTVAVYTMALCVWVMEYLQPRVAAALKSPDEAVAAPVASPDEAVAAPPRYPGEVAAALRSLGVTKGSFRRGRDEEKRTSWVWFVRCFKAENDEGHIQFFFPPKLDSESFSESEWTVIISNRANDLPGELPMKTTISLPDVLRHCGVEECRRAMVFAHQRTTVDAKRREAKLGDTREVSACLEMQLRQVGEFVPRGSSRVDALRRFRNQVVDILGAPRGGQGDDPDELPFEPPKHFPLGCYASVAGGSDDRQIVVIESGNCWTVADSLIRPLPEDDDIDAWYLPETFHIKKKAFDEGDRYLELARLNGGPSPDFE